MVELLEALELKIKNNGIIDDEVQELVEAVENAANEGYIDYDEKVEICDIIGRIQESYGYDSSDETGISEELTSLRSAIEAIE